VRLAGLGKGAFHFRMHAQPIRAGDQFGLGRITTQKPIRSQQPEN